MRKSFVVVPLATALSSLTAPVIADISPAEPLNDFSNKSDVKSFSSNLAPNRIFKAGEDFLGMLVTQNADGTVVAQHSSHYSHSSHASHASHASSRY